MTLIIYVVVLLFFVMIGTPISFALLGCALALQAESNVWALAADTDGIDGVEDNARALVTPDTLARAAAAGVNFAEHLARHDAYTAFASIGDLVVTGPTYTNVNDFRALLLV